LFGANARFKTNALKAVAEVAEAMSA